MPNGLQKETWRCNFIVNRSFEFNLDVSACHLAQPRGFPDIVLQGTPMRKFTLLATVALLSACGIGQGESVKPIESELAAGDENFFLLGQAKVGKQNNLPEHVISNQDYAQMKCLEKSGFIKFVQDEPVQDNGTAADWQNLDEAMRLGINRHISTELTPSGQKVTASFAETESSRRYENSRAGLNLLKIRLTKTTLQKVVSDKEVEKASGRYRIVEFTALIEKSAEGKLYYRSCFPSDLESTQLKSRALLKWDAFESSWKFVTSDNAISGREITSRNIENILGP